MPFIDPTPSDLTSTIGNPGRPYVPGAADIEHGSDAPDYSGEAFTNAPQPEKPSPIGAMFRQSNTVGSLMSQQDRDIDPHEDPQFRAGLWNEVKGTEWEKHYPDMGDIANRPAFEARKRQITMENNDRQSIAELPWEVSLPLGLIAGTADLPSLIPGAAFVRSAKGAISIGRSALMTGVGAGIAVGSQEALLHGTQQTRTAEESAMNIGTSVFLGGMLGAGGTALLSRGEWRGAVNRVNDDVLNLPANQSHLKVYDSLLADQLRTLPADLPDREDVAKQYAATHAAWVRVRARAEGKLPEEIHASDNIRFENGEMTSGHPDVEERDGQFHAIDPDSGMSIESFDTREKAENYAKSFDQTDAFHGSPHDFDRFDASKIGSGEGAQAFGHGLYFAQNEGVAKSYANTLSRKSVVFSRQQLNDMDEAVKWLRNGRKGEISAAAKQEVEYANSDLKFDGQPITDQRLADHLAGSHSAGKFIYKVNLKPDKADLFDFDKPLNKQTPEIQEKLKTLLGKDWAERQAADGKTAIRNGMFGFSDETVSKKLKEAGIPGIKYADQGSRVSPAALETMRSNLETMRKTAATATGDLKAYWDRELPKVEAEYDAASNPTHNFVIFDDKDVEITHKNGEAVTAKERADAVRDLYQTVSGGTKPNARVTFNGIKKVVQYFKTADASSGIHELWHLWWDQLTKDASRETAPQWMKDDMGAVLRHFGVEKPEDMTVDHHEQLSRWGEQFVREGNAPSKELEGAFAKFKEWLTQIYKDLTELGTPISDEMRGIFKRALATDEESARYVPDRDAVGPIGLQDSEGMDRGQAGGHGPSSAGAAAHEPNDITGNDIAGRAAGGLARATKFLNPFLRLSQSGSAAVRDIAGKLMEGSVYLKKNYDGVASDAAVETLIKGWNGPLMKALKVSEKAYLDYRKTGGGMTEQQFRQEVGRAMRRNDESVVPQVAAVARSWRNEVVEPLKDQAIAQGLLPKDVSVTTAPSYFSRMWNRQRLIAQEGRFKGIVQDYYATAIEREYGASTSALNTKIAKLDREVADLSLDTGQRTKRLGELDDQLQQHEEGGDAYLGLSEKADQVSDANAAMRDAKDAGNEKAYAAAKEQRDALVAAGGKDLKDFVGKRSDLRGQRRNVDLGAAGLNERRADIEDKLADLEEANQRSLGRLVKKGQKLERDLAHLEPGVIQERISALRDQFADLAKRSDAASDRATKGIAAIKERASKIAEREAAIAEKASADAAHGDPEEAVANRAKAKEAREKATAAREEADAKATSRLERDAAAHQARSKRMTSVADRLEMAEDFDRDGAEAELRDAVAKAVAETSSTSLGRGERATRLKDRWESFDPQRIKDRVETVQQMKADALRAYYDRWEIKNLGEGVDHTSTEAPDFSNQARDIADSVYNTLTGRVEAGVRPEFMSVGTRGPMKDRTFNVPDALIEDFLEHDASDVMRRYVRVMGADVEMARKFGTVDMKDQFDQITQSYDRMRNGLDDEKELMRLGKQERSDKDDLAALRDLYRGTRAESPVERNYAKVVRIANHFNYMRSMGEVVLASVTDPVRIAMVNGLGPYMQTVGQLVTNMQGIRLSVEEAQLAGNVGEKYTSARMATLADLADPYASRGPVEAFMQNMTDVASKWNGIRMWTDWMKGMSSVLTQNRILTNVSQFSEIAPNERAYLAFLGIDQSMAARIGKQYAEHNQDVGGVRVAGTENWTDEVALRTYRAALNKDVDSTIIQSSRADVPLFMHTPTGKMLLQFQTFNLASHQRVLMRGLQESQARFIGGMVAMTAMGMFMTWAKAVSGNRTEKLEDITKNPGWWISEGLDRSGVFAVPFEMANRIEKLTGLNPIKSPMKMGDQGSAESQKNQNRNEFGSMLGPTFNLGQDIVNVAGIPKSMADGKAVSKGQKGSAIRLLPFNSYAGVRQVLNYVVHPPGN